MMLRVRPRVSSPDEDGHLGGADFDGADESGLRNHVCVWVGKLAWVKDGRAGVNDADSCSSTGTWPPSARFTRSMGGSPCVWRKSTM